MNKIKNVISFFSNKVSPKSLDKIYQTDEKYWAYQDYLTMSCEKNNCNLYWFHKNYINYSWNNGILEITDTLYNTHVSLDKESKYDTIIFQGQGKYFSSTYEGLLRIFEYMDFITLNTYDSSRIASSKMLSFDLLSLYGISQPKSIIVSSSIMKSGRFYDLISTIYGNNEISNKYVVKVLNGSLGKGVFECSYDEIESILNSLFELDDKMNLMIQEYIENDGDIRIHVLSIDNKNYEIIACMKRNKINGDFRSNVSLGADTTDIELTNEQKELALSTARISKCRWVGIDIINSGNLNYVIEYNASPGVEGISKQIKKNIFDIILDKIEHNIKTKSY